MPLIVWNARKTSFTASVSSGSLSSRRSAVSAPCRRLRASPPNSVSMESSASVAIVNSHDVGVGASSMPTHAGAPSARSTATSRKRRTCSSPSTSRDSVNCRGSSSKAIASASVARTSVASVRSRTSVQRHSRKRPRAAKSPGSHAMNAATASSMVGAATGGVGQRWSKSASAKACDSLLSESALGSRCAGDARSPSPTRSSAPPTRTGVKMVASSSSRCSVWPITDAA